MKDINLQDVAFQAFLLAGSGLSIRRCTLMHLDRNYARHGALDPKRLFLRRDVTPQAMELARSIEGRLEEMLKTVGQRTCPETAIGAHCDAPFQCPLRDQCGAFLPEHSVLDLYLGKKRGFDLLNRGFTRIPDIPEFEPLTAIQQVQKQSILEGRPHIEREPIRRFLKQVPFPAYFLDFETFQMALPPYEGARPWQQIPFQFSLHGLPSLEAKPERHKFLAEGAQDPRPQFLGRLRELLGGSGSIVAYNAQFEKRVLRECCDHLPDYADWLRQIEKRFVDLLIPFKAFRYLPSGPTRLGINESGPAGPRRGQLQRAGNSRGRNGVIGILSGHVWQRVRGGEGAGAPESGSLLQPGHDGHGEDCSRSSRPMRPMMISLATRGYAREVSVHSSAWARWPWVGGRVAISQNVCENKRRETCPRIAGFFALRGAASGRNRQTRTGGRRRGGHILSKLHKIWLKSHRVWGDLGGGVTDGI